MRLLRISCLRLLLLSTRFLSTFLFLPLLLSAALRLRQLLSSTSVGLAWIGRSRLAALVVVAGSDSDGWTTSVTHLSAAGTFV